MSNISIRPLEERDIPAMVEIVDDAEIQKLTLFVRAKERGETPEVMFQNLLKVQEKGWYLSYAVMDDDRAVGYAMCISNEKTPDTYWLGVWTDANERGRSIATTALQLLIDETRALDRKEGVSSIFKAAVMDSNKASLRMMEKLGFAKIPADANAPDAANPMHHFVLESKPA